MEKNYYFKINDQHYNFTDILYITEMMMMIINIELIKEEEKHHPL